MLSDVEPSAFSYDDPEAWKAVGARIRARRMELRMTIEEVAEEGDTSPVSVSNLETGERTSYRLLTLARVAKGLGWTGDSIPKMLDGGEPGALTMSSVVSEARLESVEERLRTVESKVDEILERLPPVPRAG